MTDSSGASPLTFRARSPAQLLALHLARRFDDLKRLPRYLEIVERHSIPTVLAAATHAQASAAASNLEPRQLFLGRFTREEGA